MIHKLHTTYLELGRKIVLHDGVRLKRVQLITIIFSFGNVDIITGFHIIMHCTISVQTAYIILLVSRIQALSNFMYMYIYNACQLTGQLSHTNTLQLLQLMK